MLLFCCLLEEQTSLCMTNNKLKEENLLEMVSDQIQLRSKSSLIRPMCAWIRLWLDQSRRKWHLIRSIQSRSDHWSDRSYFWSYFWARETIPRPCNFGLETQRVCWIWVWSEVISVWHLNLGGVTRSFDLPTGFWRRHTVTSEQIKCTGLNYIFHFASIVL